VTTKEQGGIRNQIYLAGQNFSRGPVPITFTPKRFDSKIRTSNLGLRVDRPFVVAGYPNVPMTHEITMPWPTITEEALLEWIGVLLSMGQPFDVCIWKQVRDVFDGDGSTTAFYLQNRMAVAANLPVGSPLVSFPDYEPRVDIYSAAFGSVPVPTTTAKTVVHKTAATIDAGSPAAGEAWVEDDGHLLGNRWLTKVRLDAAPADAKDIMVATYIALFKMVIDQETARSYADSLREPRGMKLVQFG
jgi:hypothetical protein